MKVEDLRLKATQEEIVDRIAEITEADVFGEYCPRLISFLDYEHAKPLLKGDVKPEDWKAYGDLELRKLVEHYLDWWTQKVEDGRGLSVWRGRAQMVNCLFLAGIPLWKEIGIDEEEFGFDGGWYQEEAYNMVADLFGRPHVFGPRKRD